MQRGLVPEDRLERGRVHLGDRGRVERGPPRRSFSSSGRGEGPLHRDLLVEQHADHHRERLGRQEPVRLGVRGEVQRGRHPPRAYDPGRPERAGPERLS